MQIVSNHNVPICMKLQSLFSEKNKNNTVSMSSAELAHKVLKVNLCPADFVCVEVLWPSQPNGVMSSAVSLPNHTFTGQA